MVLANEVLGNINQFMNGLPVNQETLAIGVIDRVGPGGHYLQEDRTMKHFREVRYSKLFERTVYDQRKEAGAKPLRNGCVNLPGKPCSTNRHH